MTDIYLNWSDKNKFKNILAVIDSKKFGCKNKIDEFKYIDIKDLAINIKNNTISEISAKKDLNTSTPLKIVGITKQKKHTPKQKELLNLFNDLSDANLIEKTLESERTKDKMKIKIVTKLAKH